MIVEQSMGIKFSSVNSRKELQRIVTNRESSF